MRLGMLPLSRLRMLALFALMVFGGGAAYGQGMILPPGMPLMPSAANAPKTCSNSARAQHQIGEVHYQN